MSETEKHRHITKSFCTGVGLDLGAGGDPITPTAITIDILSNNSKGSAPNIDWSATKLRWFTDGSMDFVYSSHLLEDFYNTEEILIEWCRVLKRGGLLILVLPDQQKYLEYCRIHKKRPNPDHKIDMSSKYIINIMLNIKEMDLAHSTEIEKDYSFILVYKKG